MKNPKIRPREYNKEKLKKKKNNKKKMINLRKKKYNEI